MYFIKFRGPLKNNLLNIGDFENEFKNQILSDCCKWNENYCNDKVFNSKSPEEGCSQHC